MILHASSLYLTQSDVIQKQSKRYMLIQVSPELHTDHSVMYNTTKSCIASLLAYKQSVLRKFNLYVSHLEVSLGWARQQFHSFKTDRVEYLKKKHFFSSARAWLQLFLLPWSLTFTTFLPLHVSKVIKTSVTSVFA